MEMVEESNLLFICSSRFEPNNQGDNACSDLFGCSSAKDLNSLVKHPWKRLLPWVFNPSLYGGGDLPPRQFFATVQKRLALDC